MSEHMFYVVCRCQRRENHSQKGKECILSVPVVEGTFRYEMVLKNSLE